MLDLRPSRSRQGYADHHERDVRDGEENPPSRASAEERCGAARTEADKHEDDEMEGQKEAGLDSAGNRGQSRHDQETQRDPADLAETPARARVKKSLEAGEYERVQEQGCGDVASAEIADIRRRMANVDAVEHVERVACCHRRRMAKHDFHVVAVACDLGDSFRFSDVVGDGIEIEDSRVRVLGGWPHVRLVLLQNEPPRELPGADLLRSVKSRAPAVTLPRSASW